MTPRRLNQQPIPYDGHLTLALTRTRLATTLSVQLVELARETDLPLPAKGATAGGDPDRLRGIPVAGKGIPGVWNRTRPDQCIDRLDREARLLAILARDIDGTSPGTDPVQALFGSTPS